MYKVRLNVGFEGKRKGDVIDMSPAEYEKKKRFVTVISAPEPPKPEPKKKAAPKKRAAKKAEPKEEPKEEEHHGLLWSDPGKSIESDSTDHVGDSEDDGSSEEDSSY